MKHTEKELVAIKGEVTEMWQLVLSQLEKAKQAFLSGDIDMAREIASREKRVDAFELKIESDCENYIALYNPVAVDLRLVLSLIKIAGTLERIGDFAEGIARHIIEQDCTKIDPKVIEDLALGKMFDILVSMLADSYVALESENTRISGKILARDEQVDAMYAASVDILAAYLKSNPDMGRCALKLSLLVRKLERIGDHCSNIVEDIVFYVDAKVLKHGGKVQGPSGI